MLILYFSDPVLEFVTSVRPGSFYRRMVLKTKISGLGALVATGVPLFLGPPSGESKL